MEKWVVMRAVVINTCNMIKARANATGDVMLEGLAYSLVIMNSLSYSELDWDVWDRDEFYDIVDEGEK